MSLNGHFPCKSGVDLNVEAVTTPSNPADFVIPSCSLVFPPNNISTSSIQPNRIILHYSFHPRSTVQKLVHLLDTESLRKPFLSRGGLPIHSPSINTGRATYRNASMLLILFLYLIIGQVAGQAAHTPWRPDSFGHHRSNGIVTMYGSMPKHTPSYTSSKEPATSIESLPWTKLKGGPIVARDSTTDSGYSTASPTLSKATRTRVPCKYAPCTKTGPHECDPHPEDHCGNGQPYKRRTTSSALAQITSTEHLNQLGPGSTTFSIPHNFRCLNKLGNGQPPLPPKPTTTSSVTTTSSGLFWWWVYYMSIVDRPSKRSVAFSTLAQVNSTDNSLFYPGNTPALPDFLGFLHQLLRIINMASNDRDDSGNTPNSLKAPSKSECETQSAGILTPYTDTDKNPLDDLGPNQESRVLRTVRDEGMIPDEPIHPGGQASDTTPKKAELGTKPAPDSTPTKMVRVVSPTSDATSTRPERFARSHPQQTKSSSSTPEKPPPKPEPPKCDRCGKTGFPGFCPYCSNMNKDGVGMF
jgi:hypothetical protein